MIFAKFKKKTLYLFLMAASTINLLSGCGSASLYKNVSSNYEIIYNVEGVSFAVPKKYQAAATAVTEIKSTSDFNADDIYVYKDGEASYILFSMSSLVIVCQKGTKFDFMTADDKADCLNNSGILSIWTESTKNGGLDYSDSTSQEAYKLIANVKAQVSMTVNLFDDFIGKIACVQTSDTEWTLFVGVPGSSMNEISNEQLGIINNVAKSLKIGSEEENETVYEYTDGGTVEDSTESTQSDSLGGAKTSDNKGSETNGDLDSEVDESNKSLNQDGDDNQLDISKEESNEINQSDIDASTDTSDSFGNNEDTDDIDGAISAEAEETLSSDKRKDTDEQSAREKSPKQESSKKNDDINTEEKVESESSSFVNNTKNIEPTEKEEKLNASINVNNQKTATENKNGAKDSSIYSFLKVGEKGTCNALSEETKKLEELTIAVKEIYRKQDAIEKIKEYIASGNAGYEYTDPPVGTLWEVVVYDIDYVDQSNKPYVNILLCGVDGMKLKNAGISYPSRTYDMNIVNEDGTTQYMAYYAVPLNCREYVLRAGAGKLGDDTKAAYYRISEN